MSIKKTYQLVAKHSLFSAIERLLFPHNFAYRRLPLPRFSWLICSTMLQTEIRLMLSFTSHTLFAPIINSMLMIMVFSMILPEGLDYRVGEVPFLIFITPGLVMMNVIQNAFSQPAFSITGRRMFGSLSEILLTPISAVEFVTSQALAGIVRGLILGLITFLSCWPFVPEIQILAPWKVLIYLTTASSLLALLGLLCGLISEKWEQLAIYSNYILIPLSFLSGTFYAIDELPVIFQKLTLYNPFFYLIDGLRYGFTGVNEASLMQGILFIIALNILLFLFAVFLFTRGYKLRN